VWDRQLYLSSYAPVLNVSSWLMEPETRPDLNNSVEVCAEMAVFPAIHPGLKVRNLRFLLLGSWTCFFRMQGPFHFLVAIVVYLPSRKTDAGALDNEVLTAGVTIAKDRYRKG